MPLPPRTLMLRSSMVNPDTDQCVCRSEEQVSQGYQQRRMPRYTSLPSSSLARTDAGPQVGHRPGFQNENEIFSLLSQNRGAEIGVENHILRWELSGDLTLLKFCRGSLLCRHSDMRGGRRRVQSCGQASFPPAHTRRRPLAASFAPPPSASSRPSDHNHL